MGAGRKLFAGDWQFIAAAGSMASLPPMRGFEIGFAGRSNVGKSSLINALTGRRALARVSHTPGRTKELIFFAGPANLTLVDMPGYGYAAAAKSKVEAWTTLIHAFLRGRANLQRVYLLIDARHGFRAADAHVIRVLDKAAVSYQLVFTKTDEITETDKKQLLEDAMNFIGTHPAAHPQALLTSARTGAGIDELRGAIAQLLHQRKSRAHP
jgi:GTP-binding protein